MYEYESGSDSDADRPDPDVVLDDLASRRFHSPSPAPPTNFAVPINALVGGRVAGGQRDASLQVTMTPNVVPQQNVTCLRSENSLTWLPDEPRFARFIVTTSNTFGYRVLPLTELRSLWFAVCWFLL